MNKTRLILGYSLLLILIALNAFYTPFPLKLLTAFIVGYFGSKFVFKSAQEGHRESILNNLETARKDISTLKSENLTPEQKKRLNETITNFNVLARRMKAPEEEEYK